MSMTDHYKSNLRDIFFNLFEVLHIDREVLGKGRFTTMDGETAREALAALEVVCREEFAPSFAIADRNPPTLDGEGNVTLPPELRATLDAFYRDGWEKLELPEELEGFGAPPSVIWASFEMQAGANPAAAFFLFGTFIARIIGSLGTEGQRKRYVKPMLDRHWGGCMVLTEPDAGSDVGAGRARARHIEGDVWELEGTKRFITNGDFDAENIVHLVLARPEGAVPGTKGLSMFIVPKYWVEEDGSLGERNGAVVTSIEKKMGIKASVTAELTLGADRPCRGLLVGDAHNGIAQMFHVIEHARMAVGVKSMATLSTAYLNAVEFAKERVQGPDLAKAADKTSPRVRIIEHPDVRRMLMNLKAHAEGMRALAFYTASIQDRIELTGGHGTAGDLDRLNDLLLPLVKGYCSHRGYELLGDALQVFGGSGYVQDYPMEQYIRDQKIDSLYEGTTHIQALDLIFRKILRDKGATLMGLLGQIQETLKAEQSNTDLAPEIERLGRALADMQGILAAVQAKLPQSIYHVGLQGNRVLLSLAELVIGWRLVVGASVAQRALADASGKEAEFYEGKLAAARFFCANVLPGLTLTRKLIEQGDLSLMDVSEGAF